MRAKSVLYVWGGADKSLAQTTSRCRWTESIALLERGVCSCAELQVFSCYRGLKEACQVTRAISTTSRRGLPSRFFLFLQGKAPKEIHAIVTETLGEQAPSYVTSKTWWPSLNVVIFPPVMRLVVMIAHLILRIWPRRTTTFSLNWKNNWKFAIFRPTRISLLPRRPGWTDNLLNIFWVAFQKLDQRTKKCIELRVEYVE